MQQKNKIRILVTSAGTASAVSVIKALKRQDELPVEIFATDMDPLAAGLFLADHFFVSPPVSDRTYFPSLINNIKQHNIRAIFPIYSKEISLIAARAEEFRSIGGGVFLPHPSVINLCNDKVAMATALKDSGINLPEQYNSPSEIQEGSFPVFFKPNFSSSSAGARMITDRDELLRALSSCPDGIIQELIKGKEVTVDVFCNADSDPLVVSPRLRIAVKSGQTIKGETIDMAPYLGVVKKICKTVKMIGVCNIQFFLSENGKLIFLEINPRFAAGGLMLTVAAGANIPLMVLKCILDIPIEKRECQIKSGLKMTRYWEEIII